MRKKKICLVSRDAVLLGQRSASFSGLRQALPLCRTLRSAATRHAGTVFLEVARGKAHDMIEVLGFHLSSVWWFACVICFPHGVPYGCGSLQHLHPRTRLEEYIPS